VAVERGGREGARAHGARAHELVVDADRDARDRDEPRGRGTGPGDVDDQAPALERLLGPGGGRERGARGRAERDRGEPERLQLRAEGRRTRDRRHDAPRRDAGGRVGRVAPWHPRHRGEPAAIRRRRKLVVERAHFVVHIAETVSDSNRHRSSPSYIRDRSRFCCGVEPITRSLAAPPSYPLGGTTRSDYSTSIT